MKFIITESKLEQIIFKYLDSLDFLRIDNRFGLDLVYSKDDNFVRLYYSFKTKNCIIDDDLIYYLMDFFSIDSTYNAGWIICEWFKSRYGFDVDDFEEAIIDR